MFNFSFITPEFFDIFGIFVFGFITTLSIWLLKTEKLPQRWAIFLLLAIGISGLVVDGWSVYITYIGY